MIGVMTYAVLMTSIFVNVFIFSFTGDRLKEQVHILLLLFSFESSTRSFFSSDFFVQSEKVGEFSYSLEWYDLPTNLAADLMFIMIRASRPSTLTAGKIFDLSLQGFCEVGVFPFYFTMIKICKEK